MIKKLLHQRAGNKKISIFNLNGLISKTNCIVERKHIRNWAWFLLPALVHIMGELITYYALKPDEPRMAKDCLYIGIVLSGINLEVLACFYHGDCYLESIP